MRAETRPPDWDHVRPVGQCLTLFLRHEIDLVQNFHDRARFDNLGKPETVEDHVDILFCASVSGCEASRTCSTKSASVTSSSVARNASYQLDRQLGDEADGVGKDYAPDGRSRARMVGSRVAKS